MKRVPSCLVSFAHLRSDQIPLAGDGFDEWVLDSGAYSALNSGVKITNEDFISFAKRAVAHDPRLHTVFALDVIGKPEASMLNALAAKAAGLKVVPTWHAGEPIEFAVEMAKQFERVALGGLVARREGNRSQLLDAKTKRHHCEKFFCAVWPKWIHGFGCTSEELMSALPFAAVDSTTWALRPSMYGSWKTFGRLPVKVTKELRPALQAEALWFMNREAFHDAQWRRELNKIGCDRFRIRLACSPSNVKELNEMFGSGNGAPASPSPAKPKAPTISGALDDKWQDYWKQRLA